MNKYIIKAASALSLVLPLLAGCELDQEPYGSLENKKSWETFDNAKSHYVGLLSEIRGVSGGSNAYVTDIQSDLFNARAGSAAYNQVHNWTMTGSDTQSSTDGIWVNNFALVKQANDIIVNIDTFNIKTPFTSVAQVSQQINAYYYKAISYFSVAYAYSNVIVRYCKDYDPETAATTLGLPLIQPHSGIDTKPARATLAETDTFITNRIDSAYKYLDLVDQLQEEYSSELNQAEIDQIATDGTLNEPGRNAVKALESRYDLYTHRFDEAIDKSLELIDAYPLAASANDVLKMWVLDTGNEIIFEPLQTPDEQVTSYGTIWVSYDIRSDVESGGSYIFGCNPYYFPTQGLYDLYEDSDWRKNAYFRNNIYGRDLPCSGTGELQETGVQFWKFPTNLNLLKVPDSQWYSYIYNMSKAFRIAEQYLIIAEASLRKATPDEAQAREYLNYLRDARGASPIGDDVTGEDLVKDMQDEWTREFVGEGFRLDCLKRWHQGFKRMDPQPFGSALLINSDGYTNLEVSADNKRFVWEIPLQDLQANKNLKPNWSE